MLNLFVGAVIDTFSKIKRSTGSFALMTPQQESYVASVRMMLQSGPGRRRVFFQNSPRESPRMQSIRHGTFRLVTWGPKGTGQTFEKMIYWMLVLNLLAMAAHVHEAIPKGTYLEQGSSEAANRDYTLLQSQISAGVNAVLAFLFGISVGGGYIAS